MADVVKQVAAPKMYLIYDVVGGDGEVLKDAKVRVIHTARDSDDVLNRVQDAAQRGEVVNYLRLELPKGKRAGTPRKRKAAEVVSAKK